MIAWIQDGLDALDSYRYAASSKNPSSVKEMDIPVFVGYSNFISAGVQKDPPVDTAEFDDHVPSKLVTLLVSVRSPCAMTDVERRAEIASDTSVNMV